MDFKLKCTFTRELLFGKDKNGNDYYLLQVCEEIPGKTFTKSWNVWTKVGMQSNTQYLLEGYISTAPDKRYFNDKGEVSYCTNYNATSVIPLDENHSFPDVPAYDGSEEVPF